MGEAGWQETYDRWKKSGLNQKDFCNQEGIGFHQFQYQRNRLNRQTPTKDSRPFVEVGKLNDLQHGSDLEGHSAVLIHLGPVARLWVRADTDMAVVTKIIRAVSACGLT